MGRTWTVTLECWPLCDCWIVQAPDGRTFNRFDPTNGTPSSYVEVHKGPVAKQWLRRQIDEAIGEAQARGVEPEPLSDLEQLPDYNCDAAHLGPLSGGNSSSSLD